MDEEMKEELLQALESAANFMRGMCLDPSVSSGHKEALNIKARELDEIVYKHMD